jgi:hypothetical protein
MTTFSDLLTFTRSGSATYVDSTGTLQTAADGEPRIGHHIWDGSEWVNEGLLLESETRTNVIRYSNDLTEWNTTDSPITTSGDMFKLTANSGTNGFLQSPTYSISEAGKPVSISIDAEEDGARYMHLGRAGQGVWFDLRDGSALFATAGFTGESVAIGATRRRYEVRFDETTLSNGVVTQMRVYPSVNAPTSAQAGSGGGNDGTKGILINNGQLEEDAPRASSPIVTGASTVTRAAETLTAPSANLPLSSSAVSIAMEGTMTYADGDAIDVKFIQWREAITDRIDINLQTVGADTGEVHFIQEENGVRERLLSSGDAYTPGINVPFFIASRHGATFTNGAVDGTALTADTTPTALPDLSSTDLDIAPDFMGTIKSLRIWADDLGDSGIEEASS